MKRPFPPLSSNSTTPLINAKSESSLARGDVLPGLVVRAALADQYAAAGHDLPAKTLDSETLSLRIASVSR